MNCAIHLEVPAIGVCVSCRRVVCDSCSTRLQGRNFCSGCLARKAEAAAPEASFESGLFGFGFFLYMIG